MSMNGIPTCTRHWLLGLLCLLSLLNTSHGAVPLDNQPVITSLTLDGTNLNFVASFPSGVVQASLEFRPTLTDEWQPAAVLSVSTNGGIVEFSIPRPGLPTAFYRLKVTLQSAPQAQISAEVHYVAGPPLAEIYTNGSPEAVFHFQGQIDGSDRIVITRNGAFWEHINWDWPGLVNVNGSQWNPAAKNFLTTTGAVSFLPPRYSLAEARLEIIQGRDIVAMERSKDALIVHLDDTPVGAAPYEFKVHFRPPAKAYADTTSTAATLKIKAQIDGSDRLKITAREATWTHLAYGLPLAARINNLPWDLSSTNVLLNNGTNTFLPEGIDFSTARITKRQGRDLATMWAEKDALLVSFGDNPGGSDEYELEISFGR
jgi:hypothetical protein